MFEKTFCSSPWFHIRMTYNGSFESCRWAKNPIRNETIQTTSIMEYYNNDQMRLLRNQLLEGVSPDHCSSCYYEESFGKLNGRLRQLNKSAIDVNNFVLTMRSSPHYKNFKYSFENSGLANMAPVDLQIELGNTCNSACIMCRPEASSRLVQDYKKLNAINPQLFVQSDNYKSWTKDPVLVNKFIDQLIAIPNLRYIHFLGGETLYDEAFYSICDKLIENNLAKDIIVGTTSNGTIFDQRLKKLITQFKQFHLGLSIESVTALNDYIRWPGKINCILQNFSKFFKLRENNPGLCISLRITPNIFSMYEIDKLFVYMIENNVIAESCNILFDPLHLRIELLPQDIRDEIKEKIKSIIDTYGLEKTSIVNIRRPDLVNQTIANVVLDYYQFICEYNQPDSLETDRYNLVKFIRAFESIRKNYILDHLPRYEKFLRHYGY